MNVTSALGNALRIFHTAGSKFPTRKVVTVCASACNAGPTFCPSASCPSTFLNAAFIDAKEPDIVDAASLAVVPVISSSPCIT